MRSKPAVAAVMLVVLTAGFFGIDYWVAGNEVHDVSILLDDRIPLKPGWIWVYLAYYPFCFLPSLFPGVLKDNRLFLKTALGYLLQFLPAWAIFCLFPTGVERPDLTGSGLSVQALRLLYAVDPGYNIFPSLHVANAIYVCLLGRHLLGLGWSVPLLLAAALISASTVFVKQHYLVDIPAGALLGAAAYWAAFSRSAASSERCATRQSG